MAVDVKMAAAAIADLLDALGAPENEHTAKTPLRAAKAWAEALAGYGQNPAGHLGTTFPVDAPSGLVIVAGIRYQSICAHHMLPVVGKATVAYLPQLGGRVVGLSKLARLVDGYARRLTVQEEVTAQVADAVQHALNPLATVVMVTAEHGCMTMRGIQDAGTQTTTSRIAGAESAADDMMAEVLTAHRAAL